MPATTRLFSAYCMFRYTENVWRNGINGPEARFPLLATPTVRTVR